MRIAAFADIHGNVVALQAVLAAVQQAKPDLVVFLGDALVRVPMPAQTMALLHSISHIAVRGNYDWIATGDFPNKEERFAHEPYLLIEVAWVQAQLTQADMAYLASLPLEKRLFAGTPQEIVICHASPGRCWDGLFPVNSHYKLMTDADCLALLPDETAPTILCGHTHAITDRIVGPHRIVNPGSVSLGWNIHDEVDGLARWCLLDWTAHGWQVEYRSVEYDLAAVWQAYEQWELWPLLREYAHPRDWGEEARKWALATAVKCLAQ